MRLIGEGAWAVNDEVPAVPGNNRLKTGNYRSGNIVPLIGWRPGAAIRYRFGGME